MTVPARTWEEIKRIKSCGVFLAGENVYVAASARTIPGFEIDSEPIVTLDRNSPPALLGDAVLAALDSFRFDVEPPDPRVQRQSPLLKQSGFRSWKQFEKSVLYVLVRLDHSVFVTPTVREPRRGYAHRPDLECECSTVAQDIGKTLLKAFALCT